MTPTKTECNAKFYTFGQLPRRAVVVNFSGGTLTSDGGVILMAQIDQHYRISERLAGCFRDGRAAARVQHELKDLLAQRLYGLVQGYEASMTTIRYDKIRSLALRWGN
jgi:hypothetical protein